MATAKLLATIDTIDAILRAKTLLERALAIAEARLSPDPPHQRLYRENLATVTRNLP